MSAKKAPEGPFRDRIRELRRVRAADLIPNPENWRTHPPAQAAALRSVLDEIGFADAALVREVPEGLQLIDGHLRAELEPEAEVPVLILDVDEAEARLLLATLDPLAAMAGTDGDRLAELLGEITLSSPELEAHLAGYNPTRPAGRTDPDEVPEPPDDPITKPGDLWLMGEHRLLCGDSTGPGDVARLYAGAVGHAVVTDPPYGIEHEGIANDGAAGLPDLFKQTLTLLPLENAVLAAFQSPRLVPLWLDAVREAGQSVERLLWLHRKMAKTFPWRGWVMASDAIVLSSIGNPAWPEPADFCHDTYEKTELEEAELTGLHTTIKPSWVVEDLIRKLPAGPLLEPFGGSGTTVIAAERAGRACLAMEIDPAYCDVIVRRWEDFTGNEAKLDG